MTAARVHRAKHARITSAATWRVTSRLPSLSTITRASLHDILNGSAGNDVLIGGGNDDVFVFAPGDGADTIADFFVGAPEDRIWFAGTDLHSLADVQAHASTVAGNTVITYNGFFTVTLNGVSVGQLTAGDFIFT